MNIQAASPFDAIDQKAWRYLRRLHEADPAARSRAAVTNGLTAYTYNAMFREWERYAAVFSALGMTGRTQARVGLLGAMAAESIFAFYGLNMTGARVSLIATFSAFRVERVVQTIREEALTDLIVADDLVLPGLLGELLRRKRELGLRSVLLLHVSMGGAAMPPALRAIREAWNLRQRRRYEPVTLNSLLTLYKSTPIAYAPEGSDDQAVTLHTSGTTSGTGKPVVLSDRALNATVRSVSGIRGYDFTWSGQVCTLCLDLSNAFALCDQVHIPLAMGSTVAVVPAGALNPLFPLAMADQRVTLLFCTSAMLELWMKQPLPYDFSALREVVVGGTAISAADKRRYAAFLQKHGGRSDILFVNGYGISELGGACAISTTDIDDEAIGYLLPGMEARFFDEDSAAFFTLEQAMASAPRDGVLYLRGDSMTTGLLDGSPPAGQEIIEGLPYINTNDLVRVDESGKLTYLGRANRYFLNQSGFRYESGRVETEISRQPGIESCAIVPVFSKTTHDNLPMLCVKTLQGDKAPLETVRGALTSAFVEQKTLDSAQLPNRVLIADQIPRNANGKPDLYRINRGGLSGDAWLLEPVFAEGVLTDLRLVPLEAPEEDLLGTVVRTVAADLTEELLSPHNKPKESCP